MAKQLSIGLDDHSYPIVIKDTRITANDLAPYIKGRQVMVVTNDTIAPLYLQSIVGELDAFNVDTLVLPDGEQYKNQATVDKIYDALLSQGHSRTTTLIALGGGVIGDMTGYAAACYQRGVNFIQIPTTLLSQVDSSVGGKTGINHPQGKNMIGAFKQPNAVFIDIGMLSTLAPREFSAGYAEVVKYALLGDAEFLTWLESNWAAIEQGDADTLISMIAHCCDMKAQVVEEDEKEHGKRALLNLGHTFGHAIEVEQGYGQWLHGEAVATGMIMAARLSQSLGKISTEDVQRVINILEKAKLPVKAPQHMTQNHELFLQHMAKDKKVLDGSLRLILLDKIGSAVITSDFELDTLINTIRAS